MAVFARRVGGGASALALGFAAGRSARAAACAATGADLRAAGAQRARRSRDVLPFADGYGMEIGMTIDAVRAGHRVIEIELDLAHRADRAHGSPASLHRGRQLVDFVRAYARRR